MCIKKNKQKIQYKIGSPIGNEFPQDCYFPLKLFKKRIKEFPFIKKQPRFKKTLYTSETKGRNDEKKTDKVVTSWYYFKRHKQQAINEVYGELNLQEKGILLLAYWIPTKFFYHPEALRRTREGNPGWFLNEKSYRHFLLECFCLTKNKHLKIVGRCSASGDNILSDNPFQRSSFLRDLLDYCWGRTNQKPSLEGYVIDEKILKKMKKMETKHKQHS